MTNKESINLLSASSSIRPALKCKNNIKKHTKPKSKCSVFASNLNQKRHLVKQDTSRNFQIQLKRIPFENIKVVKKETYFLTKEQEKKLIDEILSPFSSKPVVLLKEYKFKTTNSNSKLVDKKEPVYTDSIDSMDINDISLDEDYDDDETDSDDCLNQANLRKPLPSWVHPDNLATKVKFQFKSNIDISNLFDSSPMEINLKKLFSKNS